ncbi:MAG: type II toxin-antitoxin system RelB/DinJ family antitoxin [Pseudomonadota bacterium]|nr:type II toxin-antitoxin system RelB/DinJ family antitoxin [Pseudomonadota bacterium]
MTSMITARVDAAKRKAAEKVFDDIGITTSGAVNLFICAVAMNGGIPFPVGSPRMSTPQSWHTNFSGTSPQSGLRLGLADGKYGFAKDFDTKFDALDSEIAELFA